MAVAHLLKTTGCRAVFVSSDPATQALLQEAVASIENIVAIAPMPVYKLLYDEDESSFERLPPFALRDMNGLCLIGHSSGMYGFILSSHADGGAVKDLPAFLNQSRSLTGVWLPYLSVSVSNKTPFTLLLWLLCQTEAYPAISPLLEGSPPYRCYPYIASRTSSFTCLKTNLVSCCGISDLLGIIYVTLYPVCTFFQNTVPFLICRSLVLVGTDSQSLQADWTNDNTHCRPGIASCNSDK